MAINEPNMRLMKRDDLDAVVAIDTLVSKQERRQYYERKIDSIVTNSNNINTSLVAEVDGKIVGFMMGMYILASTEFLKPVRPLTPSACILTFKTGVLHTT